MLALHFFLKQFSLLYTDSIGVVYGAGFADINVTLWVYRLLTAVSLIGVYTFLRGFAKRNWKMILSVPVLLIVLPPMAGCLCWQLCLTAASAAAALFRLPALEKLCRAAAGAVRVLIAVLAVFALLMVVSTSVIAFCGKGGGA